MWCYQRPGYEAVLLAELQRQQQGDRFCDTRLKAGDITVPAHSCVLSALSPQLSSALSSTPAQSRLLDFGSLGSCTLLHIVSLLYSGEMMGQGEEERQEAVTAASKLGIHGLVEVTKSANKEGVLSMEVGVQTEQLMNEENGASPDGWSGRTLLFKELHCQEGACTQTESKLEESAPPPPPQEAASFQTINISDLQSLGDPSNLPYIPVCYSSPPDGHLDGAYLSSSSTKDATTADLTPVFLLNPSCSSVPPAIPFQPAPEDEATVVVAAEEWEDSIPDFINYFLNLEMEEETHSTKRKRGRPRGSRGSRARTPPANTRGWGRAVTHKKMTQEVKGSKLQMKWLHRCGGLESRTGQGGGRVGRKPLKPQKRTGGQKEWEIGNCEKVLLPGETKQCGWKRNTQQQPEHVGVTLRRSQRWKSKSVSTPAPPPQQEPSLSHVGDQIEEVANNESCASRSQLCSNPSPGSSNNKQGPRCSAEVIAEGSNPTKDNLPQSVELLLERCSASEGSIQSNTETESPDRAEFSPSSAEHTFGSSSRKTYLLRSHMKGKHSEQILRGIEEKQAQSASTAAQTYTKEGVGVRRRRGESVEDRREDANVVKRVRFETQTAQPTCESAERAPEAQTCARGEEAEGETLQDRDTGSSNDETLVDVEGDEDGSELPVLPPSHSAAAASLGSTGSGEEEEEEDYEDVDVVGGASPAPEVETLTWTSSSPESGRDEEIDVCVWVKNELSYCR